MKRLVCAAAILVLVFAGTLYTGEYLSGLVGGSRDDLIHSGELAEQGDWAQALRITEQAYSAWLENDFWLHVLLHHKDIDGVLLSFYEVREYLKLAEPDQYTAANARLVAQLQLLIESEQLTVKNVL